MLGNELITGESITLVATSADDAAVMAQALRDPAVLPTLPLDRPTVIDPDTWYAAHITPLNVKFAIHRDGMTDGPVGFCGIGDLMWQARQGRLLVAFADPAMWKNGVAVDVLRTVARYSFMEGNLNRLAKHVPGDQSAMLAAFQAAGWTDEGHLRQHLYRDGAYIDEVIVALLRSDWADVSV